MSTESYRPIVVKGFDLPPDVIRLVTIFDEPSASVTTVSGRISFEAWLHREKERIDAKGQYPVAIRCNPDNGHLVLAIERTTYPGV